MQLKLNLIPVLDGFVCYDNSVSAYNPTLWAYESIEILRENMIIGSRVNRDFSPMVQEFGDTVNTRKPAKFTAKRKTDADNVTVQDAIATNIPVKLNQHMHVSFLIKDGQMARSFKNLVREFLAPAMIAQAKFLDTALLCSYLQFMSSNSGQLGQISSTTGRNYMVDGMKRLNTQLCPDMDRSVYWTANSQAELLKTDLFTAAYAVGDDGTALRRALLGQKYGMDHFLSQNMASITYAAPITGAVNMAAGAAAGVTTLTVDGLSAAIGVGTYMTVAGDDTPLRVVSTTGGSTPTAIVFTPATKRAVVDNAVIKLYTPLAVNFSGGYAADYSGPIVFSGSSPDPVVGQGVSFGATTTGALYGVMAVDSGAKTIVLDRPLDVGISDTDKINMTPAGDYNLACHRDALTLVIRPLELPDASTGVRGAVVNDAESGLTMRAVMTYDGTKQGHLVTLDYLMGIKILDTDKGTVIFG